MYREDEEMLKSCQYCGRIHDSKFICPQKPKRKKYDTEQTSFRSGGAWRRKSENIRKRDRFLCQICIRNKYGTVKQYNAENLGVHHITPIAEDYGARLDNDNLITLCERHHNMAEHGEIPAEELRNIAKEQNNQY